MFTGIIESVGEILRLDNKGGDFQVRVKTGKLDLSDVKPGDSIATNGVCLTATALPGDGFVADVSAETIRRTAFRRLKVGSPVNLEKALTPLSRLGGHLVIGHVDGVAEILSRSDDARSVKFQVSMPAGLEKYIAEKGSICVDGVSLTVNAIEAHSFYLNIVPHTT
ncbi:MAG: riboflavin synthase, partial [Ketobacteraceae bacterium]|nr:riboflavin synthase [Ketobacteraceae bacterium]